MQLLSNEAVGRKVWGQVSRTAERNFTSRIWEFRWSGPGTHKKAKLRIFGSGRRRGLPIRGPELHSLQFGTLPMEMLRVIVCLVCWCWSGCVGSRILFGRSGGYPKFPVETCGARSVAWSPQREPRIVGGQEPPRGAVPWQIQLRRGNQHRCGGALLSSRLVSRYYLILRSISFG